MAKALITESLLTNIASAIRAKAGTALTYTPAQMATAITNLPTGGGDETGAISNFIAGTYAFPSAVIFNITSIRQYAFYGYQASTTSMTFTNITSIAASAFCSARIGTLVFPSCTTIGIGAFTYYSGNNFTFEKMTAITAQAFYSASFTTPITQSMFPSATIVQSSAFRYAKITAINMSKIASAYQYAFANCTNLVSVNLPVLSGTLGIGCFMGCTKLQSITLPLVRMISASAFNGCTSLSTIILPVLSKISGSYAFRSCYHLLSLYLLSTAVVSITGNTAFTSTPISIYTTSTGGVYGSIYVRASLLSAYQSASVWSAFSARFVGLTDAQISALGF